MKRRLASLLFAFAVLTAPAAHAALNVFACEPEWGALVKELAGDKVSVDVATSALQNVHQIEAKPSLIAKVRRADLLICSGAELEQAWLPQLIRQSGNAKVASGNGYFMAAAQVTTLDRPSQLDRAAGDIHPQGNPHVQTDPYRMLIIAKALSARLAQLDAANAPFYQQHLADFSTRWNAAIKHWETRAAPLKGRKIIVHHKSWAYLNKWLGLVQVATMEPKPGVPPTSSYLVSLIGIAKTEKPMAIVLAAYQDPKAANWLSERSGIPIVVLPFTVGGDAQSKDLFSMYDSTINKLLGAAK